MTSTDSGHELPPEALICTVETIWESLDIQAETYNEEFIEEEENQFDNEFEDTGTTSTVNAANTKNGNLDPKPEPSQDE